MSKPRLSILIPRLGITDRGAEVFVYELSKRLKDRFEVTLWVRHSSNPTPLLAELTKLGIKIKHIKSVSETHPLVEGITSLPVVGRLLEKLHLAPQEIEMCAFSFSCLPGLLWNTCDLLFPNNGVWGAIISRFVRRMKGIPFVYASHGGREPLIAHQNPNLYVAIHRSTRDWLVTHYPQLTVVYIPNGVDTKRFSPHGPKANTRLPHPLFVTAAALVAHKRVDLTIKAVGTLKKGSLLILGDGPLRTQLVTLAKACLGEGRFQFLSLPNSEMPNYYRAADVFTLAAPWEIGIGLVQTEAMACGLPVVCNDEPTTRKMIGRAGLACDVRKISTYAYALKKAGLTNFGSLPRLQAQKYAWEKVAKIYESHLWQLVNSKKLFGNLQKL